MRHSRLAALGAALLAAAPFAARADEPSPEFKEHCKKAASKELGLTKKDIDVIGKRKNSDGYTMVDFHVSDGRRGSCRALNNGKIYDVKIEGTATKTPKSVVKQQEKEQNK